MKFEAYYYQTLDTDYSFILVDEFTSDEHRSAYIKKVRNIIKDQISKKYNENLLDIQVDYNWDFTDDTLSEIFYEIFVKCKIYCHTSEEDYGFDTYTEDIEDIIELVKNIINEVTQNEFHKAIKDEIDYCINGDPNEIEIDEFDIDYYNSLQIDK